MDHDHIKYNTLKEVLEPYLDEQLSMEIKTITTTNTTLQRNLMHANLQIQDLEDQLQTIEDELAQEQQATDYANQQVDWLLTENQALRARIHTLLTTTITHN